MDHEPHDFDRGLAFDMTTMLGRRRALALLTGAGAAALLAACGTDAKSAAPTTSAAGATATTTPTTTAATTAAKTAGTTSECSTVVPGETAGPYPGDGSNGPDVLADQAVVRRDITGSFGDFSGTAEGVPTTITLTVLDSSNGCQPLAGGAVYLWHADRDGRYSMYTAPDANYLRGVQEADATGTVEFQSIFPGCYDGRWPHIHFEVFPSTADALAAANLITTSQIAIPEEGAAAAYQADGYSTGTTNLGRVSLATDNVFRDGWGLELGTVTGTIADGFTISLTITV